jgi:hypothetical protein
VKKGHRFIVFIAVSAIALIITGGTAITLGPSAEELAKSVKFDRKVLMIAMQESGSGVQRLIGYDESNYQIMAPGISVTVPEDRTDAVLKALREKIQRFKYMAFVVEMNEGMKTDTIGILKGSDQYDILRVMHTGGDDDDVTNEDLIERLKGWEKGSSFDIIGADNDWVELEFTVVPKDLKSFAEEVNDFCPDAVEKEAGSVDGLISEIRKTRRLLLWWD